jgi:diguanylate cyclase (GGDEF)-like protein
MSRGRRSHPAEVVLYRRAAAGMREGRRLLLEAVAASPAGLVVLLDLDGMGRINHRFGTAVGDRLLAGIEAALQEVAAGRGGATHLGGDQFLAVVTGGQEPDRVVGELRAACRRTRVRSARVTASAGACGWSEDGARPHELLSAAAQALERAKLRRRTVRWPARRPRPANSMAGSTARPSPVPRRAGRSRQGVEMAGDHGGDAGG